MGQLGDTLGRYLSLLGAAWSPAPGRRWPTPRRVLVMTAFVPLFTAVQGVHVICLLLDNILYPGYRRVAVREPVFVLGVPRSGTTMTHRVLARDPNMTTFSVWECLLAPSILQRRVILGLARVDRVLGEPGARAIRWLERRLFGALDDVHAMDLRAPEEDYLALLPVMACFILVIPFPGAQRIWRLAAADTALPAGERDRLMHTYTGLLRRHLYVHGHNKRMLSKNAAFAGMAGTLRAAFPDARFLRCDRAPESVVPSQLSSIQGGISLFDSDPDGTILTPRMVSVLGTYYRTLDAALPRPGGPRHAVFDMAELKNDLAGALGGAYAALGLPLDDGFRAVLEAEGEAARRYRSRHHYSARDFGLESARIASIAQGGHDYRAGGSGAPLSASAPSPMQRRS